MTKIVICPTKSGVNLASAADTIVIDATVYNKMTNDDDIVSNVKPTVDKINPCPHQSSGPGSTQHWPHWLTPEHQTHTRPLFRLAR